MKEKKYKLVFFDLETTGLEEDCDIIEAGIRIPQENKIINKLFKPHKNIGIESSIKTNLINLDVEKEEYFEKSEMFNIFKDLSEKDEYIFIAHNIKFDSRVLKRYGINLKNKICTMKVAQVLSKWIYPEGEKQKFGMQYLRYYLKLDEKMGKEERNKIIQHRTDGDVFILEKVFNWLLNFVKNNKNFKIKNNTKILEKMIKYTKNPIKLEQFNFGKYKGQKIEEVKNKDPNYTMWLLSNEMNKPEIEKNEDLIYSLL